MKRQTSAPHLAFLAVIAVKGLDGLVESLAGLAVAILGTQGIYDLIFQLTAPELDVHPESRTVHLLRHGATTLTHASSRFVVVWLLVHGVLKVVLAAELFREKSWVFPVAAAILTGFVLFMTYKMVIHYSPWLLALALFDLLTAALVLNEWRSHRARNA